MARMGKPLMARMGQPDGPAGPARLGHCAGRPSGEGSMIGGDAADRVLSGGGRAAGAGERLKI